MRRKWVAALAGAALVAASLVTGVVAPAAAAPCDPGNNPVVCENSKPGNPSSEWDVTGAGSSSIQGFATDMSVNVGTRVDFKIKTGASDYTIKIFRLGYYGGNGARLVTSVTPSAGLPQTQPPCLEDASTNLYDCGNWGVSAGWDVPSDAVSGIYLARIGSDAVGYSHIVFVVRNDASHSNLVFQTSDTTWQAYNTYGGSSFYTGKSQLGTGQARAYKLSYNRPFITRSGATSRDFLFANEYPMLRFLERNGYDVSYISGLDTDRSGSRLLNHRTYLSVGHDEYWSGGQRANVEAARAAGVNLAFFSGNESYWKTRWEPSIDGSGTANRTLVSYKETWENAKVDPSAQWTGTWRDPRFSPPADGGRPENQLSGTAFMSNDSHLALTVQAEEGNQRLWQNTRAASLTSGEVATLAPNTVGYESDEDLDNGFRNPGQIQLSTTTGPTSQLLRDWGNSVIPGTTTHHMTMYKATSGAKVFSAGSIQFAWGLDAAHDAQETTATDSAMQQFTVNLLADLGATPDTLMPGMAAPPAASTDTTPPQVTITSPAAGAAIANGTSTTVSGTATDVGGVVAGVEVSVDGGATWHAALGRSSWSYTYLQHGTSGQTIRARATDDSLNTGPAASVGIVTACPCTLLGDSLPVRADSGPDSAVTLGVRFQPQVDGWVTGMRFYKASTNTGTHQGGLWGPDGTRLAVGTFTNETASGWQELDFTAPVKVTQGTFYVAGYSAPNAHYASDAYTFSRGDLKAAPLTAPGTTPSAGNGLYAYGAFQRPTQSFAGSNYWVDVTFNDRDTVAPAAISQSPLPEATSVSPTVAPSAVLSEDVDPASLQLTLKNSAGQQVSGSQTYNATTRTVAFTPASALAAGSRYTVALQATDTAGNAMAQPQTWSFTVADAAPQPGFCPCRIWSDGATPAVVTVDEASGPLELGTRFTPTTDGQVTGLRFYKGPQNTGTHTGSLWSSTGTRLATATFTTESSTGWQTVQFGSPVDVQAGATYLVSYSTVGFYSATWGAFASAGVSSPPLTVGVNGGAYIYGGGFPSGTSSASYWVDPIFTVPSALAPTVTTTTPAQAATDVGLTTKVSFSFGGAVQPGSGTITVTGPSGAVAGTTALDASWRTLTFTPAARLALGATYTATVTGAKNLGGWAMSGSSSVTFTTGSCPCSLFASTARPGTSDSGDGAAVSLGVKVVADENGNISGVRFYKDATNTGIHTGSLWSAAGALLATATFTSETASGWQSATFSQPVAVTAGTTYVVSYYAPNGHFSVDQGYFDVPLANAPLSSPAGGTSGNGVFRYGSDSFPDSSFRNSNYWVDAVFQPGAPPPDTVPPVISAVTATPGANGTSATITWTTNESSTTRVDYGTTTALGSTATGTSGTAHSVTLSALAAGTYYYRVVSADAAGNSATDPVSASPPRSFIIADTTAPTITSVSVTQSGSTATVTWTTDETSTSRVDYGTTTALGSSATGTSGTAHTVTLTGLVTGTYYYRVTSADAAGNSTTDPVASNAPRTFAADATAPTISAVSATGSGTTITVTWTTDESSSSSVSYGTTTALGSTATGTAGTSHTVSLTGLLANTRYYYRVTSADVAANSATSPAPPAAPASYVPTVAPITLTTVADFATGTGGYASDTAGGEVMGGLVQGQEFAGTALPSNWTTTTLVSGGTTTISGGTATVSGAKFRTNSQWGGPNSFTAAATLGAGQSLGWGSVTNNTINVTASFVMDGAGGLSARVNDTGANNRTLPVAGTWAGTRHTYRIDWASGNAVFFIDGTQVATSAFSTTANLRVIATDPTTAAPALPLDWVRVTPFSASTYTSAVVDAGGTVGWDTLTRDADVPTGTTVTVQVRSGATATPGTGWTAWTTVIPTTGSITRSARYLQYRLQFTSSGTMFTSATVNGLVLTFHVL